MSKNYKIAILPGDGTGPEVVREGMKVLNAAASKFDFSMDTQEFDWGGDRYLSTGNVLPDDVEHFKSCGADCIFPKPLHLADLESVLHEYGVGRNRSTKKSVVRLAVSAFVRACTVW